MFNFQKVKERRKFPRIGENCKVRRFVRWEVGEGIEVVKKDYAEEIAEMTGQK